ncbi:MAG: hypothetical protein L0229_27215 [Blastocatellia bacterium]|nr:hypothetical protein [Blastocatellia bacterium]
MAKADRITSFFPAAYRAEERTRLLYEVVRLLAWPIEEADTHLFRIQRAHRLKVAEHADDIMRLAAALNLTPFHFEDILKDESLDYDRKLDLCRRRVRRIAAVHLRGLGTPRAVMEAAAIFLNAVIVPERAGDPLVKHIDAGMFSHRATIEFSHLPEKPRDQIYLHENPLRRRKVEPAERWQMNSWVVENRNVEPSEIKVVIEGVGERTIRPTVFCPDTEEGLFFNGIVPDGKTLVIDRANGAVLDGLPVDEWLTYFKGGSFDFAATDSSAFVSEEGRSDTPFDGNLETAVSRPFRKRLPVPVAPVGKTEWHFKGAEGVYDGSDYDYSLYATSPEPVGVYDGDFNFDMSVFDYPAGARVGMAWDERIPCSFKLLLPATLPRTGDETAAPAGSAAPPTNHLSRVGNILPRFKAAGIRAFVDVAKDAWILGQSRIRSSGAAEGEGIEFHATRLQNQNADILVPLDTTS